MPTRLTLPLFIAALPLAAQQAPNRPAPAADETVKLETFVVTGSNIRRTDAETALPVSVIDLAEVDARGAATMAELFETLGAAEISAITEINNGPQLARGDVASVDLRGMGSGSTLTLLNGRRMAPHPVSMAENGVPSLAVNINTVPRALLERVEVLRDGASAVYGSDAAAGVLNNRINRNFNGRGFTLKGSATQHGGANEFNASAYQGFTTGKTHIAASVDYFHRDALAAHDRWFARNSDLRVPLNITLLNSREVNAFALPGGIVVVHTGLIQLAQTPEELAGVLAHEVQHVELRHSLKGMAKSLGLSALLQLFLGDLVCSGGLF